MESSEDSEGEGCSSTEKTIDEKCGTVTSLVVSPHPRTSTSQALSPIRKTTDTAAGNGVYEDDDDSQARDLHIHSDAVVKSSEVEFPVQFHELQSNTDLKMPPSNWLQATSTRLPNPTHKPADFSSFFMAHQFPDCVGEVDVVSSAENIKKLLKIPYNPKAHVSMMIHRVGKTLLIDDFDIYKYLLRQSEKEWQWLRKFFFEHVLQSLAHKENVLVRPNKSRHVVQSRSLLSKFLYHSINEEEPRPHIPTPPTSHPSITHTPVTVRRPSVVVSEGMPEPSLEEQLPHATSRAFTRNVVWNFEDLHMLIGTDLPIFGGGTHPCVSLRLHDMSKPINILTGIDYWLDNLMCNVPEVVMCYHLDGIVQKYQLIKTEDLPHTSECQFSPRLVRDVAQNILAFLNSRATKEGHTYWLFKGKDDDIVKLYDLTSLCMEGRVKVDGTEEEESQGAGQGSEEDDAGNPFTVPVAMLFYRVAKNMRASRDARSKIPSIRALLSNALSLLDHTQYPKIVSSAHYMLSDLYVPQDVDPDSPALSDCSDEESEWSSVLGQSEDEEDDDGDKENDNEAIYFEEVDEENECESEKEMWEARLNREKWKRDGAKEKTPKVEMPEETENKRQGKKQEIEEVNGGRRRGRERRRGRKDEGEVVEEKSKSEEKKKETEDNERKEDKSRKGKGKKDEKLKEDPRKAKKNERNYNQTIRPESSSVTTAPNTSSSIKISTLCKNQSSRSQPHYYKAPPLLGSLEERCMSALTHVTEALTCLHSSTVSATSASTSPAREEEEPKMARPFQPIPMPYSPLNQENKEDSKVAVVLSPGRDSQQREQLTVSVLNHQYSVASWWDKLHVLLLRKASLVYLVMARTNFTSQKFGLSLRYLRFSLHAWHGMTCRLGVGPSCLPAPVQALTLAGDVFYMLARNWNDAPEHIDKYNTVTAPHTEMLALLEKIIPAQECNGVIKVPCDVEEALSLSASSLDGAIVTADPQAVLMLSRRLGNVCNELGVMYMNQATKLCDESEVGFKAAEELWHRSERFLRKGLESFTHVQDSANMALLHSNTGRLLRLCAFYCSRDTQGAQKQASTEQKYYEQAMREYQRALEILVSRGRSAEIWDLVVWEYSTTLYTLASVRQDHLQSGGVDREVVELLNKALKYCDVNTSGPRQPLYQYRAAVVYMRLAGMYHSALREGEGDGKTMRHLAEVNYKKAAGLFLLLENPLDIFKVQLDRVVLLLDQTKGVSNIQMLSRLHLSILHLLVDCLPALKMIQPSTSPLGSPTAKGQAIGGDRKISQGATGIKKDVEKKDYPSGAKNLNENKIRNEGSEEVDKNCNRMENLTINDSNRETPSETNKDTDSDDLISNQHLIQEAKTSPERGSGVLSSEDEETRAKTEELLELFEKKLHGSLKELIKIAKKGSLGSESLGTLKKMYSASLNVQTLPQRCHLMSAIIAITPLLNTLPQRR